MCCVYVLKLDLGDLDEPFSPDATLCSKEPCKRTARCRFIFTVHTLSGIDFFSLSQVNKEAHFPECKMIHLIIYARSLWVWGCLTNLFSPPTVSSGSTTATSSVSFKNFRRTEMQVVVVVVG